MARTEIFFRTESAKIATNLHAATGTLVGMNEPGRTDALWPEYQRTPLIELPTLARLTAVRHVFVKDESKRPLGNFKVLGGMMAGLRALHRAAERDSLQRLPNPVSGRPALRLICASDGNHGLAVAAAAERFGAHASIYLPVGVSGIRAERILAHGGDIVWISGTYDDAVSAASQAADRGEGLLIADTSCDARDATVAEVMSGYGVITDELAGQFRHDGRTEPTHLFIQAGVGGLAAIMAERFRYLMQPPQRLVIVEPAFAACVAQGLQAGVAVQIAGDLHTSAEMLSCGRASALAIDMLLRHDAKSILVTETQLRSAVDELRSAGGPDTTPSGAAGLAGLILSATTPELRSEHQLTPDSSVLLVVTEGALTAQE